ncbi:hypothetical protein XENOCAPTIV_016298 [Xenoophorus captivus]|uniref:Uncharacterized protein n=1 Tax=Xenoophorus captivus TaxID=1517983 RepID=A0ABV0Q5C3_9TELE
MGLEIVFSYEVYFLPCPSCLCSLPCVLVPWVCSQFVPRQAPPCPRLSLSGSPAPSASMSHQFPVSLITCPIVSCPPLSVFKFVFVLCSTRCCYVSFDVSLDFCPYIGSCFQIPCKLDCLVTLHLAFM